MAATDREKMTEAISRYAWGYDTADYELLAEAFTSDATSSGKVAGTDIGWGPMTGRDEIVSILKAIRETQKDQRRHCISNLLFLSETDSAAKVRLYLNLITADGGESRLVTGGQYEAELVKDGDLWRISRLDALLDAPF